MPSLTNGERRNLNITSNPAQARRSRKDAFGSLNSEIGSLRPPSSTLRLLPTRSRSFASAKAGRRTDPLVLIDGARGTVDGPLFESRRLCRAGRGRRRRWSGRPRFGGKAGPTGLPYAVDAIGLPLTEEHSNDDQGGEGADEPDHNGDFLQSFHENLLLQPWSAVTRR